MESEPLDQMLRGAWKHWEESKRAAAAQPNLPPGQARAFTVALEREAGTQDSLIAAEVGKRLGWHVYDHELLERIAREMGVRTALLESVDERNQNYLLEAVESFASISAQSDYGPFVGSSEYVHYLVQTVLALGLHGDCVIVGRGAAFILPAVTTLRVRLIAPVADRVAVLAHNLHISEQEAAQKVRALDRERADFVRDHFLKDPASAENYDLVLNSVKLPAQSCAEMIVEMLRRIQASQAGKQPGGSV